MSEPPPPEREASPPAALRTQTVCTPASSHSGPISPLHKQSSMPSSMRAGPSSPGETLDQSISFLSLMQEQLIRGDANPAVLARELAYVVKILTAARETTGSSAIEQQRTLQRDLKHRAQSSGAEDADVIRWISSQYNTRALDDADDAAASPPPPVATKPWTSLATFRSTMLCMRYIRKTRECVHRRALARSPWENILSLHVSDPIKEVLSHVDEWDFDLLALEKLAGGRVLSVLAYHLLETRLGFMTQFKIRPAYFANFITAIEDGYLNVPYHSHIHASDVLQTTYWFLTRPSQRARITDLDLLSACLAAAIHDFRHPGTNNVFQVATQSATALRYNDKAVLENMHVSEAFLVLTRPHHNILSSLKPAERTEARSTIISMVLATDMSAHFRNLAELKSQLEGHRSKEVPWSVNSAADRLMIVETALHCADVGNPTKPLPLYLAWTERVMAEFFQQGDAERALGMPISAMMDREKKAIERSQLGFMSFIVQPLYEAYAQLNTDIEPSMLQLQRNFEHFQALIAQLPPTPVAASSS